MSQTKLFKKKDLYIIIILAAVAAAFFIVFAAIRSGSGAYVVVYVDSVKFGTYDLNVDQIVEIAGEDGIVTNTLVIEGGEAYMESADCPDHLCIEMGRISKNSETIICLPNKVVAEIEGEDESALDAIAN